MVGFYGVCREKLEFQQKFGKILTAGFDRFSWKELDRISLKFYKKFDNYIRSSSLDIARISAKIRKNFDG